MNKKVLVGMSGGVDSSVAAKLLVDSGYEVEGVTARMFSEADIPDDSGKCAECFLSNVRDAGRVAEKLGIKYGTMNLTEFFRNDVVKPFGESYLRGETPNPCIECNKHIKFGKMLEKAEEMGFDYIATGHYAKVRKDEKTGRYLLIRPTDRSKDQTYVLYTLSQHQLAHTIFPLGNMDKPTVRKIAEDAGLINSKKPDSQDICFIPDGDYAGFIERVASSVPPEGNFIDKGGKILGRHKGIIHYTIGQRKGLGVTFGKPVFVIAKNAEDNTVTLGNESELFSAEIYAKNVNFISVESLTEPMRVTAKARYSQQEQPASIYPADDGVKVIFDEPQRAAAKGQAVVFYDGDIVVGGGTIC